MIEHHGIRAWWQARRKPKPPLRLMLTHAEFRLLVGGCEVERDGVVIALSDIGFHEMSKAINDAWELQMRTEI